MADPDDKKDSGLSIQTLLLAASGSVLATLVISRFGLAGTLIGAALTPIIVITLQELGRRPTEQIATASRRAGERVRAVAVPTAPPLRRWWRRVRWSRVLAASAAVFVATVAAFTVPELVAGRAATSDDRRCTFCGGGTDRPKPAPTATTPGDGDDAPAPAPATDGEEAEGTTTATTPTATTPTTTAPATTGTTPTTPTTTAPTTPTSPTTPGETPLAPTTGTVPSTGTGTAP
jgi:hypothetical protein